VLLEEVGEESLRHDVLAGGFRLWTSGDRTLLRVILAGSGAVMPELLAAAHDLEDEGVSATVLSLTSLDRLYSGWRQALRYSQTSLTYPFQEYHLAKLIPEPLRNAPIVTVHDAASHAMAWLGSVYGQRLLPVGVDEFGESGTIQEIYERFGLLADQIVNAALVALAANGDI
jgi:pyruvate dehydrogenase E1 component